MLTRTVTLVIPERLVTKLQAILDIEEGQCEDYTYDETIERFTAEFPDGVEADIKVCNGDTPYVDPVLFLNGSEVQVLDVCEDLLGEYEFDLDGDIFIVRLEKGDVEDVTQIQG